jgi:hypothetical protein
LVLSSDSGAAASSSSRSSPKDTTTTKPATGWRAKWQQLLEEADKQRTIQNDDKRPGQPKGGGKDRPNRGKR